MKYSNSLHGVTLLDLTNEADLIKSKLIKLTLGSHLSSWVEGQRTLTFKIENKNGSLRWTLYINSPFPFLEKAKPTTQGDFWDSAREGGSCFLGQYGAPGGTNLRGQGGSADLMIMAHQGLSGDDPVCAPSRYFLWEQGSVQSTADRSESTVQPFDSSSNSRLINCAIKVELLPLTL